MENFAPSNINEWVALLMSVFVGSGAYIMFVAEKKNQKIRWTFVGMVFFVNTFLTWTVAEILKLKEWGEYRGVSMLLTAFFGQYFLDWVDKRYLKIGDAGFKKISGIDLNENKDETFEENNNIEELVEDSEEDNN